MRKKIYTKKKVFFQLKVTYGRKSGVNLELNRKPVALNPTLRQMNELTVRYTRQTGAKVKSHVLSRVKLIIRILVPGAFLKFKCAAYEAIYPFTCLMYTYINSRQNRSSILFSMPIKFCNKNSELYKQSLCRETRYLFILQY